MKSRLANPILTLSRSLISALALFLLAGYPNSLPPWALTKSDTLIGLLFAGGLSVAILLTNTQFIKCRIRFGSLGSTLVLGAIICLPILVLLVILTNGIAMLPVLQSHNAIVITLLVAFFGLLVVNSLSLKQISLLAINIGVLAIAAVPSIIDGFKIGESGRSAEVRSSMEISTNYIYGTLHDVKVTDYLIFSKRKVQSGGGLNFFGERRVLLVAGDGEIVLLDFEQDQIRVTPTTLSTPYDPRSYRESSEDPTSYFRVTDSLVETIAGKPAKLYVSYHHWNSESNCLTLKVAEAAIDFEHFGQSDLEWTERFTSSPCVVGHLNNGTGGRLALLGDHTLLLTVGTSVYSLSDEESAISTYGKIIALDKRSWDSRIFSSGHRNPQGLLVVHDEIVWSTEHGPKGGDELNLIKDGADYGWPLASYGTNYGRKTFSGSNTPGDHTSGVRPVYSWVPSIGISSLISMHGASFPSWRDDFMVSSLLSEVYGRSLYRVKIVKERVVVNERMYTGLPVRDLLELEDGRLVLWEGRQIIQVLEPAELVFSQCNECHSMEEEGIGPPLMGIVGDPVARSERHQYSDAMKRFGGSWTRRRLDDFLQDPSKLVPGTTMVMPGIADPEQRDAIIDYLEELRLPES